MRSNRKIVALLCAGLLLLLLTACGSKYHYYMDVEGNVSWDAVEGAVGYEAQLLDENSQVAGGFRPDADVTSAFVPAGYGFRIRPVFEDGSTGDWMEPMYVDENGEAVEPDGNNALVGKERVDADFTIYWEDLQSYEILSAIDRNTVETGADGSIFFEAAAPNGGVMRFEGVGIELTDEGMILQPGAGLYALDAIGRISAVCVSAADSGEDNWCWGSGGYTFAAATSVESREQLYYVPRMSVMMREAEETFRCAEYQPNFVAVGASVDNGSAVTLSAVTVYYDEETYNTGLRMAALDTYSYGTYLAGEHYDPQREQFDLEKGIYDFALALFPDVTDGGEAPEVDVLTGDVLYSVATIYDVEDRLYTIGELRDAQGNVLDKETDGLSVGSTLDVTLGDYTMAVELPVAERYAGAQTLHELVPYDNAAAQGETLSLVIPVVWQDQPENGTEELLDTIYAKLGRVMEPDGTVTDYSGELTEAFSLSDYFDTASYGQYAVTSFVTEWYAAPHDFEEMKNRSVADDEQFRDEIYTWLMATYPDMDWSRFDGDSDGFFDSVIIVNAGENQSDAVAMMGYGYALFISTGYTGENAGSPDAPALKNFVSINMEFLGDNTLIHEVSHSFGIIDYYDVDYSGIDAVGTYDMQSAGLGDWNAYSKYAVGWIEPEVISGLESGESVEVTIGAFADTGDAVVIPAAGADHDGPFGEYILLDLFTDGGVNRYDAAAYALDGAVGVRVSHVDANMETRVLTGADGVAYPIGTTHRSNAYNQRGMYQVEVIQAGGVNTFTDPAQERKLLAEEDLFGAGDVFDAAEYTAFLADGCMDDGSEFGYTVEIVSIQQDGDGAYSARIRVTRV